MAILRFFVACIVVCCLVEVCYGVTFSSLEKALLVTASTTPGQVLKAGEDNITVSWSFDMTSSKDKESTYKTIKLELCYAPISQVDRGWRKTDEHLKKDKTCQHKIVAKPYSRSNNSFTWVVEKDIPTATYFVRAYVFNSNDVEVAFGQTTDSNKKSGLFEVKGITGRSMSIDIASACFSAFSILALLGFFYVDKRNTKMK